MAYAGLFVWFKRNERIRKAPRSGFVERGAFVGLLYLHN